MARYGSEKIRGHGIPEALEAMSHDLNTLPALLVVCVAALAVTVLLLRRSILTEKLARRGQHIVREYSVDLLELTRVAEVMDKEIPLADVELSVAQHSEMIAEGVPSIARRQGTVLVDKDNRLAGIITRGDLIRALQRDPSGRMKVTDAGKRT